MAKKKGGLGRIFGAITGSPYERLLKQVEKLVKENSGNETKLAKHLKKLVQIVGQNFKEENIDEEEHDLIIEAIEEVDPNGRTFPKISEEEDAFYAGDVPDAPELKRGKRKNLDDLMTASGKEFVGSYGRDEFDDFKARMTDEFYAESDEAIAAGDHQSEIRTEHRVFAGAEDDIGDIKKKFAEESGLVNPDEEEEEEGYSIDENGVEWFEDEDGYWWYREPGQDDWQAYDE
tara:strand:- start:193 stop:888 length:696 start_codon:yes stop_codon:yes gene_type:complete